jgi:hypothetical protein
MRDGFSLINLRPLTFDPARIAIGQTLVGHAFAVEPHDEGAAIVIKSADVAHAFDPSTGRVVVVPTNNAIRIVARGALQRLLGRIVDMDTAQPRDVVPCFCFEVVELLGARALVVGESVASSTPRHAFTVPQLLEPSTLTVVEPAKPAKRAAK